MLVSFTLPALLGYTIVSGLLGSFVTWRVLRKRSHG